jgi:hypothetical protein
MLLSWAAVVIFTVNLPDCKCAPNAGVQPFRQKDEPVSAVDFDEPEHELFLWTAMRAMEAYRKEHGQYPDQWYLLEIAFALPSYRVTDTDVHPTREQGSVWRPRGCKWTYVIKNATATTVHA